MCADNLFTAEAQRNAEIRREEFPIKTHPKRSSVIVCAFCAFLWQSFNREVFCVRMVDNNSRSRLLWFQLKFFAQLYVDTTRIQQREKFFLIFKTRTRGISKTVARPLVLLMEQARQLRR